MTVNSSSKNDIALIGLAVMGQNLALNVADNGYRIAVYNRTTQVTDDFVDNRSHDNVSGYADLESMVSSLESPRRIMLLVRAGNAVDKVIDDLLPLLDANDVIIDLGNSHYEDTQRRWESLQSKNIHFIGSGISGGEEGARHGPSIMPGGSSDAWNSVQNILEAVSAKVDNEPCTTWIGNGGSGHFVKMVHNGIEYGDMQLIAESYQLMHEGLGLSAKELNKVYGTWNAGDLDSYLIEITSEIFKFTAEDGEPLVDKIMDKTGQKGTGKWTGVIGLKAGTPVTLITQAVFERCISAQKEDRVGFSKMFTGPDRNIPVTNKDEFIQHIEKAVYAAKIISYTQGFMLLKSASEEFDWCLDFGGIAKIWRGGCIIRSHFLNRIADAYQKNPKLPSLVFDEYFRDILLESQDSLRIVIGEAIKAGISTPILSAALNFLDSYRSETLPANLIQAQRDYFGAHMYERVDKPAGEWFHTDWIGQGGGTSSNPYSV